MSKNLFDCSDESDGGDESVELKTNEEYAKSYNSFRKKELLKKFKDKGYDVSESESSADDTSSTDDDEVNPVFDKEFYNALASLKRKDPVIYDRNTKFFEKISDTSTKRIKDKPVTLKDYERKVLLEKGGKFNESDEEEAGDNSRSQSPTLVEEEKQLKAEFKKVIENSDSEEEDFGGIFKKREKTKQDIDNEETDFIEWLSGKETKIEDGVREKLGSLKEYWTSDKLPQNECFLRDYILNKGYSKAKLAEIPTYEEIVEEKLVLSEDEKELEKQAEFEHKYNFRFEEPDTEFIKRFPRTIENSVRRTDDKRKQKRKEIKERKEKEKEQKMKELEIVKEMKRKEIEEKIHKLKLVTGNDELGFKDNELEEDFDPDKHDERMQEIFNEEYYEVDEGEEKPDVPSDVDELRVDEDWDNYEPGQDDDNKLGEGHCEDEDFNMDCDYDPVLAKQRTQEELMEATKGRRKRRKLNRFKEMLKAEKPPFNPEDEKTYAEYIDEYYKIDCEDIIGDIPCRFKYVETTPNDFGLTIEEILLAKNKELNQWASLKKMIQNRPEHVDKTEQRIYKMKAKNEELKRKIFKSLYGNGSDSENDQEEEPTEKEKNNDETKPSSSDPVLPTAELTKKKKRKKKTSKNVDQKIELNEENLLVKKRKLNNHETEVKETGSEKSSNNVTKLDVRKKEHNEADMHKGSYNKNLKQDNKNKTNTSSNNPFNNNNRRIGSSNIPPIRTGKQRNTNKFGRVNKVKNQGVNINSGVNGNTINITTERFKAYKINPKKFLKKRERSLYGKSK